jgi:hypothetical protein
VITTVNLPHISEIPVTARYAIECAFWYEESNGIADSIEFKDFVLASFGVSESLFDNYSQRIRDLHAYDADVGGRGAVIFTYDSGTNRGTYDLRAMGNYLPRGACPIGFVDRGVAVLKPIYELLPEQQLELYRTCMEALLYGGDLDIEGHVDQMVETGKVEFEPFRWVERQQVPGIKKIPFWPYNQY